MTLVAANILLVAREDCEVARLEIRLAEV